MTWTEIIAWARAINEITKEHQKWAFNWIMITFFGDKYLKYLTKNLIIEWVAKAEAEKQIAHFSSDPNPVMAFIKSENELEYQNMFWVLEKTIPKIQSWVPNEEIVDKDKMKRLKDLTKEFSSDEMQEIISWILAWEYNIPWSYSLKTMEIVKNLTKNDIELFRNFCWMVIDWDFYFWNFYQLANKNNNLLYTKWIWYDNYLYLQELWLVTGTNSSRKLGDNSWTKYSYQFLISKVTLLLNLDKEINLSMCLLTKAWKELFNLIEPIYDEEMLLMCKDELIRQWFEDIKNENLENN